MGNYKFLTGTSTATTMHTLNNSTLFQFRLGHTANTIGTEVSVTCLNASQTAEIFVARLLPFGNQIGVSNFLSNTIVVQLTADRLTTIVQIVNVTRLLMMDFEYGPQ